MQVFSKDSNLPDAALGDSDCVELCAAVEQVACLGLGSAGAKSCWRLPMVCILAVLEWIACLKLTGPTRQCEGDWTRTTSTL